MSVAVQVLAVLNDLIDVHLKVGSVVSSFITVGERKRIVDALTAAKAGTALNLRDTFLSLITLFETKFAAELQTFKHTPVFARFLRGSVMGCNTTVCVAAVSLATVLLCRVLDLRVFPGVMG